MKNRSITLLLFVLLAGCAGNVARLTDEKSAVNPPFKGVTVPFSTYKVDPTVENTLETERGTLIHIPANALVDVTNQPITEEVTINYRPFHIPAEIIASGIPMTYDSTGQSFDFVSAGMFELTATVKDEPVFIKKNEQISIELATFNPASGFSLYELDEVTGDWSFIEANEAEVNTRKAENVKTFKDAFLFNLDLDYAQNPELRLFDTLSWTYAGDDATKDPAKNEWIFNEKWRTVKLELTATESATYTMHLTSKNKKLDLMVSPYVFGEEETVLQAINNEIAGYNEVVQARKSEEFQLQMQADMVRKFEISRFGICNIDTINRMIENDEIFAVNARFLIDGNEREHPGEVVLFTGDDKTMLMRRTLIWDDLYVKSNEKNALIIILPNNKVAYCGQAEFERAKGKTDYAFNFTNQTTIKDFDELEALLDKI